MRRRPVLLWVLSVIGFLTLRRCVASALSLPTTTTEPFSNHPISSEDGFESSSSSSSSSSAIVHSKTAVIVGGGPVGLATALTLSQAPHNYQVTVLEKTPHVSTAFDPTRAYHYNLNERGLQWMDQFPAVLHKLQTRAVIPTSGMGRVCYIPADPTHPIPNVEERSTVRNIAPIQMKRTMWIPRHELVQLLQECCLEPTDPTRTSDHNSSTSTTTTTGSIQLLPGKQVHDLAVDPNTQELLVTCVDGTVYQAALVVAADGMDSAVRSCLSNNDQQSSSTSSSSAPPNANWLHANAKQFQVKQYRSPSTGMRMKSLQFTPGFVLTNSTGEPIPTNPETMFMIWGINTGTRDSLSLGMLPVKDPHAIRSANINTRPNHVVWNLTNGASVQEFFHRTFPRLAWDTLVSDAEWDRFAKATGTTFPHCQYSPGSVVVSPSGQTGVVLVGDACHAFPPDIGQGINAGLQDVVALDRVLKGQAIVTSGGKSNASSTANPITLGSALLAYQTNRGPEHKALIHLARCGAPYQYRQPWIRDRVGRFLWTLNVALRMILHKLSGTFIPPAAILLAQDHTLTFRQVMRRATLTSRSLAVLLVATVWLLVFKR